MPWLVHEGYQAGPGPGQVCSRVSSSIQTPPRPAAPPEPQGALAPPPQDTSQHSSIEAGGLPRTSPAQPAHPLQPLGSAGPGPLQRETSHSPAAREGRGSSSEACLAARGQLRKLRVLRARSGVLLHRGGCPPWQDTERVSRGEALEESLHMCCVGSAVPRARRLGWKAAPRLQGTGSQWREMQGAAPRTHVHTCSGLGPSVPCTLTRTHTHILCTRMLTRTLCTLTRTHRAHTHTVVCGTLSYTHMCTHSCHMCTDITCMHTLTCTRRLVRCTWPLPPPAQAQPTHSETNTGALSQGLPTPSLALRPPAGHHPSPDQHACPCTFEAKTRPGHPGAWSRSRGGTALGGPPGVRRWGHICAPSCTRLALSQGSRPTHH